MEEPRYKIGQKVKLISKKEFTKYIQERYDVACNSFKDACDTYTADTKLAMLHGPSDYLGTIGRIRDYRKWNRELNCYLYEIDTNFFVWEEHFLKEDDPLKKMLTILKEKI